MRRSILNTFLQSALAGLFVVLTSTPVFAVGKEWHFVQEGTERLTLDVVSNDNEAGSYDVTATTSRVDPKTQAVELKTQKLGFGIKCSEHLFGDGSNPALTILSCENELAKDSFLLISAYPSRSHEGRFEVEFELFSTTLGSVLYQKMGTEFSRTAF